MKARELLRYKKLLLTKLQELSASRGKAGTGIPGPGGSRGDDADQANSDTEAELQIRLHQSDVRLIRAIDQALVRMKQDAYGVCVACGQAISKPRLNAVPWTHFCRDCEEKQGTDKSV